MNTNIPINKSVSTLFKNSLIHFYKEEETFCKSLHTDMHFNDTSLCLGFVSFPLSVYISHPHIHTRTSDIGSESKHSKTLGTAQEEFYSLPQSFVYKKMSIKVFINAGIIHHYILYI